MSKGVIAAAIFTVVITITTVATSFAESGKATKTECSAKAKTANLEFTLKDMHGNDVRLSDYSGNVLLLDFWATWCGPCRVEIPGFIELYDKYKTLGFSVLGISVDDPVDALRSYAEELGMNYPVLIGDGRDDVKDAFGPMVGFPTTFIIDRHGSICHQHTGFASKNQFEQEIIPLLETY